MALNERSRKNLVGVHPDLVRVVELAASKVPFVVTEGLRNLERQKKLKAAGKSWTLNSRHLTGHAVDVVDDDFRYDIPDMNHIAVEMKAAAKQLDIPIVWGGDWKTRDTPHFELLKSAYPASGITTRQKVQEVATKVITSRVAITAATGAGATVAATETSTAPTIPAPPAAVTDAVSKAGEWRSIAETVHSFGSFAWERPFLVGFIVLTVAVLIFGPKYLPEKWRIA
jgi:peptidoglycan L-alanyl-D-glutamate endopeptidase CwlK